MPVPAAVGYAAIGIIAGLVALIHQGPSSFVPGVCERLEPYLLSEVVGQELAVSQLSDAICDHVSNDNPHKPLVVSVHGPPGVGKSMSHLLAARALYNQDPSQQTQCPGQDCPGYKVLYGMDYISSEKEQQLALLRASLLEHCSQYPEALIVVEEYDKLDCSTRGFLRQLFENARAANVTLDRSVIILESNSGYLQLHELLQAAGHRGKVRAEDAQRVLKDLVFDLWRSDNCEERSDTLKMLALVDFFLPFLPLERPHIERLFGMKLVERRKGLVDAKQAANLTWDDDVVHFLTDRVDFEGPYPIEGAKEVSTLMTRYISRALRAWSAQQAARKQVALPGADREKKHGALTSRVMSTLKKMKGKRSQPAPKEDDLLPIAHLAVGKDALGNPQVVAQTQQQLEQCVGK
ncbi:probable chaperone protein ClpB [Coccomyxa sp. Obi]|nr:probable chaperone protein ClpB [Coccomyxa sp. Obi]